MVFLPIYKTQGFAFSRKHRGSLHFSLKSICDVYCLRTQFQMKDLGDVRRNLCIDIIRTINIFTLVLNQASHVEESIFLGDFLCLMLEVFIFTFLLNLCLVRIRLIHIANVSYSNAIEFVIYLIVCTRPDTTYSMDLCTIQVCIIE